MQKEYPRSARVADLIQRELAMMLQTEVKDPRIGMVTITMVDVTREFDSAKVYFTVLGDSEQVQMTTQGLQSAAGFLRAELAKRLKLRQVPALKFEFDKSISNGNRLSAIIDKAVATDELKKHEIIENDRFS